MENAGVYKCEAIYIIGEATITKESTTATLYIRGFRNIFLIVYHLCIEKRLLMQLTNIELLYGQTLI